MSEEVNKYLAAARRARNENNTEEAKKYYDMVRTDDPDCAEARFFYVYYKLVDGTKGESYNNFIDLCNVTAPVIRSIAESGMPISEQETLIEDMFDKIKDEPVAINRILNQLQRTSQISHAGKMGMQMLYDFGDMVEKHYGDNARLMKVATAAWKAGVYRQQQWYGMGMDKSYPEKYTAKIQRHDPTYTLPKKAGCISISK